MARKECYLYVQTVPLLLRLNLSDLCESGSSAEFEIAHNYYTSEGRVPIGMACIVVGSKIYMVGGERSQKGSMLYYRDDEENWFNTTDVYVFDHTKPESEDRLVPVRDGDGDGDGAVVGRLNGPKTRPFVFTLEGKFYVLSTTPELGAVDDFEWPFEVFDPTLPIPSWKALPHQPNFPVRGYFAWGHKLVTFPDFYFFDAKDEKWAVDWDFMDQFTVNLDANGQLNAHWVLDELSEVFEGPSIHEPCEGFLTHIGGGRMCLLFTWQDKGINWIIRVQVFQVSITTVGNHPDRPVVNREIMRTFDLRSWNHYNAMIDSVFVCDHSNKSDIGADASSGSYRCDHSNNDASSGSYSCEDLKKRAGHAIEYVKGDSKKPKTTLPE